MERAEKLSIGEFAEQAGVTPRTIRYYVSEGLLPPPGGAGPNRVYGHEHYVRLQLIKRLQQEHLPLQEIKTRLARLSLAEMEKLLKGAPPVRKRVDPRRLLAAVLAPGAAETAERPERPTLLREMLPKSEAAPATAAEGLWRRVTLAPGVELHYQISGDPGWDAAVQQVIADATGRLVGVQWADDGGPRDSEQKGEE